jgi:hypothetical protein
VARGLETQVSYLATVKSSLNLLTKVTLSVLVELIFELFVNGTAIHRTVPVSNPSYMLRN